MKAEELAIKYCKEMNYIHPEDTKYSLEAETAIDAYKCGYQQAEKEFALVWNDIPKLLRICENLKTSWWFRDKTKEIGTQPFWEEVLKRFDRRKQKATPKWLYRMESSDPNNGLWYNAKGEFCFNTGIGSLDDSCTTKSLPMGYDERYRQDGRMWFSSCSNQDDLLHWFSKEDAMKLKDKGFVFMKYLAIEYVEYKNETVFIKESCIDKVEIDINDFFK